MKIYAYTNNNELDEFIGSDLWLLCDVSGYGSPWKLSDDEDFRYSVQSYAQTNPAWVRLFGKLSHGKVFGDSSMIVADELAYMTEKSEKIDGEYYFGNVVEHNWNDTSNAPISKMDLHNKDWNLTNVYFIDSSDISVMYPVNALNTDELFEEYPDDYYYVGED